MNIQLTETRYSLKEGTKTVYTETSKEVRDITEEHYNNYFDSVGFFRRLGGKEKVIKSYTSKGYKPVRLISTSPDKTIKVIREFKL